MNLILEVYQEQEEQRAKEMLANNYNLSSSIVGFLGQALDGKQLPKLEDLYPNLFKQEINDNNWIIIKEQFKQFAAGYNQQHNSEGK